MGPMICFVSGGGKYVSQDARPRRLASEFLTPQFAETMKLEHSRQKCGGMEQAEISTHSVNFNKGNSSDCEVLYMRIYDI